MAQSTLPAFPFHTFPQPQLAVHSEVPQASPLHDDHMAAMQALADAYCILARQREQLAAGPAAIWGKVFNASLHIDRQLKQLMAEDAAGGAL